MISLGIGITILIVGITLAIYFGLRKGENKNLIKDDITDPINQNNDDIPNEKKEFDILTEIVLRKVNMVQSSRGENKINGNIFTTNLKRKTNYHKFILSKEKAIN